MKNRQENNNFAFFKFRKFEEKLKRSALHSIQYVSNDVAESRIFKRIISSKKNYSAAAAA